MVLVLGVIEVILVVSGVILVEVLVVVLKVLFILGVVVLDIRGNCRSVSGEGFVVLVLGIVVLMALVLEIVWWRWWW